MEISADNEYGNLYSYQSMNAQHLENTYYRETHEQGRLTIWNRCEFAHLFVDDAMHYSPVNTNIVFLSCWDNT